MFGLLIILFIATLALLSLGGYFVIRRRERMRRISLLLSGVNLLAHLTYTESEWRRAAEDEFDWVKHRDDMGHVLISPDAVYIKDSFEGRLIDLSDKGKVVTHASYRGGDWSPLKLRVRWKIVERRQDSSDRVRYYKEDYRIPVPPRHREDARRVADYFTAQLEKNLAAYTDLVAEDEPLSLFGKDGF